MSLSLLHAVLINLNVVIMYCDQTPKRIAYETAFLLIGGGSNSGDLPKATDELVLLAAA